MRYLIIILILLTSCQKDEACSCDKNSYEMEVTYYMENGVMKSRVDNYLVASEKTVCQEEQRVYTSGTTYYDIKCN